MLHGIVRVDIDAWHLADDPAVEAPDYSVGLRRTGPDVAVVRAKGGSLSSCGSWHSHLVPDDFASSIQGGEDQASIRS